MRACLAPGGCGRSVAPVSPVHGGLRARRCSRGRAVAGPGLGVPARVCGSALPGRVRRGLPGRPAPRRRRTARQRVTVPITKTARTSSTINCADEDPQNSPGPEQLPAGRPARRRPGRAGAVIRLRIASGVRVKCTPSGQPPCASRPASPVAVHTSRVSPSRRPMIPRSARPGARARPPARPGRRAPAVASARVTPPFTRTRPATAVPWPAPPRVLLRLGVGRAFGRGPRPSLDGERSSRRPRSSRGR